MKTKRGIAVITVKIQSVPLEIMEFMAKSIADVTQSGLSIRRFLKKFRELQDRELLEYPKAN